MSHLLIVKRLELYMDLALYKIYYYYYYVVSATALSHCTDRSFISAMSSLLYYIVIHFFLEICLNHKITFTET